MRILSFLFILTISLFACQNSSSGDSESRKAGENELVERLMEGLSANPTTQQEKDRNAIINYAIDSLLDVQVTPSGIYYQIIEPGEGISPETVDVITINYRGRLFNGKEFDSSYKKGKPLTYSLGRFIPGWQEGIPMLKPGGKGFFLIPSHLAYGPGGFGNLIPPNSPLRFDVELIEVKKAQ